MIATPAAQTIFDHVKPHTGDACDADTLLALPDEWRFELIEGKLHEMAPTGDEHGGYTYDLGFEIGLFVRANGLGRCYAAETGFLLARNPDTVLAPDFAFVSQQRRDEPRQRGFVPVAPDLVLETRSPSDRPGAVATKMRRWIGFGVQMALDLSPSAQTLTVYRAGVAEPETLTTTDTLDGGDVLPGFTLPLSRLFIL